MLLHSDDGRVVLEGLLREPPNPHSARPACEPGSQVTSVISKARIERIRDTISAMQTFRFCGPGGDPDEITGVILGYRYLLIHLQRTAMPLLPDAVATRLNTLIVEPDDLYTALNPHAEIDAHALDIEVAICQRRRETRPQRDRVHALTHHRLHVVTNLPALALVTERARPPSSAPSAGRPRALATDLFLSGDTSPDPPRTMSERVSYFTHWRADSFQK